MEDAQPVLPRDLDHEVRALGRPTHAEDAVAAGEQPLRDGVEDLVEPLVADAAPTIGTWPARKRGRA
jgi:hypothetical protein